jgi:F420-dependent oxidoreductase-like protein
VKIGLQIPDFSWPGGAERIGPTLADITRTADEAGFEWVGVMDHLFQIRSLGPPEKEMLEAYTALGFMAANSKRANLVTIVTGVHHRQAGLLAKIVTTLDVLSGGRAWLGIGAGWNEQESRGLGIPFPPLKERFEQLQETLQVCLQMWSGEQAPFEGKQFRLARPLNSPQSLQRPHPPIMIGGMGEKKTLRLVARYADACNLFPTPELPHKLAVLRRHCETEGRDYDSILKTAMFSFDVGERGEKVDALLGRLRWLASMGVEAAIGSVRDVWKLDSLKVMGERVIPAAAQIEARTAV